MTDIYGAAKLALEVLEINLTLLKKINPYKGQEDLLSDSLDLTNKAIKTLKTLAEQPAQRTWVGLSDEEIFLVLGKLQEIYNRPPTEDSRIVFARAIEAKLKEKNT